VSEVQRLLHDPVFYRLGLTLLHFLWQGLVVALLASLLRALLQRETPALRYLALALLLTLLAAAPVATFALCRRAPSSVELSVSQPFELISRGARARVAAAEGQVAAPSGAARTSELTTTRPLLPRSGWLLLAWTWTSQRLPATGLLWMLGVLVLSARLLVQWAAFVGVVRRGTALEEHRWQQLLASLSQRIGVTRAVRLLESGAVGAPTIVGWLRPVILLPPAVLVGLTPDQLEAVLAHELAHVFRHDFVVNVFQRAIEVLLFFHPAVWWLSGLIRVERELCCDDLAVTACGDAIAYAHALTAVERLRGRAPEPALGAARRPVATRVRRLLLSVEGDRRPPTWSALLFPVLALAAIALTSSVLPAGGPPYIVGTLLYAESSRGAHAGAKEFSGEVARGISGRTGSIVRGPVWLELIREYSPQGDAIVGWAKPAHLASPWGTAWKPDSECHGGMSHLWKLKVDPSGRPDASGAVDLTELSGTGGDNLFPRWSHDGRRLLFEHARGCLLLDGTDWERELWVMNADGSGAHKVAMPPGGEYAGSAEWTSDGSLLYGVGELGWACANLGNANYTVLGDPEGRHVCRLPITLGAVSPDGSWVVGVHAVPPRGAVLVRSTPKAMPSWHRPDTGEFHWDLLLMRPDGTEQRALLSASYPLAELPYNDAPDTADALRPHGFAWSPDSRQFAFVAALHWDRKGLPVNRQVELFVYDLPSGRLTQMTHDDREQSAPVWMG
jgi:beta-lactamase regulating signal transducer with metallopeptidase domain